MKTLYKIGMLAVAALAFVGCSKEVDVQKEKTTGTHTLTFKVQKDIDTKTAVVEGDGVASYVWTAKDDQYFHIYENGVAATDISMELSENNTIATFTATFEDTEDEEFSYTAVYGSEVSNAGNPMIINEQTPALDSFDPAADVLVSSKPITLEGNAAADEDTEFLFTLKRVASVNKMTLKGLTAGEKVVTVELASDQNFSARYMVDKGTYTGNQKKLVFDFSGLDDAVVGTDGTFPVYFVSAPVENATFSVRVVTESTVYTRDDFTSKLTLAVGTFRRFGINLSGYGTPIQTATEYKLVENDEQIVDGAEYLIVAKDKGKAAGAYNTGKYYDAESVTVNNKVISITSEPVQIFTLESGSGAGKFYVKDASGQYVTGGNKSITLGNTAFEWTITSSGMSFVLSGTTYNMQYNNSNPRFTAYSSSQTAIELYVNEATMVELADPELSFDGEATINVAWADINDFEAPALNNPYNVTVTYSSSNPDVATVDATTGEIEFVGDGTTIITASSTKTDVYKAGSAQYTLIVTGAPVPYAFNTIAELNALANTTAAEVTGQLTNAIVSFVPNAKNAIIKDGTGSVLLYVNTSDGHGLKQGQTFTGEAKVSVVLYNGYSEITSINAAFTGEQTNVNPETVALATIASDFNTWQNAYVKVENLEVDSVNGKYVYVKNGQGTYQVYSNAANAKCAAGDIITAIGTVTKYSNTPQIKVWFADDIVVTQEHQIASHTITFNQPEEGGSFTVEVDGDAIESGAALLEGTVVSLNASVENGYSFNGWTVTGAVVSGNTVSETFTVGTDDVSISALITKDVSGTTVEFTGTNSGGMTSTQGAQSGTIDDVTIDITSGLVSGDQIRIYKNQTITISVPSGKVINKIEFTCTASGAAQYGPGCFEAQTGYSYSGPTGIWTGSASSVSLKASSDQVRATSIKVTYK